MTADGPLLEPSLEAIVGDIARCRQGFHMPSPVRENVVAWSREFETHVDRLKAAIGGGAWWMVMGQEAGHDLDILDQIALQTTQWAIAIIARAMNERQGEPFEAARVAIVAYEIARIIAGGPDSLNIEGLKATDDLGEAVKAEARTWTEREAGRGP